MKRILLVVGLLAASVVIGAQPAAACSCAPVTDRDAFDAATVVFAGTVIEKREPKGRPVPGEPGVMMVSSGDPATWVFGVERSYKGEVGGTQEVLSPTSGASCGLELGPPGTHALVFAHRGEAPTYLFGRPIPHDALYAGLCGGSRRLAGDDAVPVGLGGSGATRSVGPALAAGTLAGLVALAVALRPANTPTS